MYSSDEVQTGISSSPTNTGFFELDLQSEFQNGEQRDELIWPSAVLTAFRARPPPRPASDIAVNPRADGAAVLRRVLSENLPPEWAPFLAVPKVNRQEDKPRRRSTTPAARPTAVQRQQAYRRRLKERAIAQEVGQRQQAPEALAAGRWCVQGAGRKGAPARPVGASRPISASMGPQKTRSTFGTAFSGELNVYALEASTSCGTDDITRNTRWISCLFMLYMPSISGIGVPRFAGCHPTGRDGVDIKRHAFDRCTDFQSVQPAGRNFGNAVPGAQYPAGDCAGAVAVA
jgi:hypothetical protein